MKKIILATAILALAFTGASAQQKVSKKKNIAAAVSTMQAQPATKATEAAPAHAERAAHPFSTPAQQQIAAPAPQPIAQPVAPATPADRPN